MKTIKIRGLSMINSACLSQLLLFVCLLSGGGLIANKYGYNIFFGCLCGLLAFFLINIIYFFFPYGRDKREKEAQKSQQQ